MTKKDSDFRERLIVIQTETGATTYGATELVELLDDGGEMPKYDQMHFLSDLEKEQPVEEKVDARNRR